MEFENTVHFDLNSYCELNTFLQKKTRWARYAIPALVALFLLLSKYTLLIGIGILALLFFVAWAGSSTHLAYRHIFDQSEVLQHPIRYGVSEDQLWKEGKGIEALGDWERATSWNIDQNEEYLTVTVDTLGPFYFSADELCGQNALAWLLDLCESYVRMPPHRGNEEKVTRLNSLRTLAETTDSVAS